MSLKIVGAGFGRTGTLSMKAALEQLGFKKCHHMMEVFPSDFQLTSWHEIGRGGKPDWDEVFHGFQASVDFPSSSYWRELAAHYPDAKVILTTRSFDSWYESVLDTIYPVSKKIPGWMTVIPKIRKIKQMTHDNIWNRVFHDRFEDRDYAREIFEQHEASVKAEIPVGRLLVFHPKEGWEPLCAFLDVPVPDTPFPNVNDRADFKKRVAAFTWLNRAPWIAGALVVAGAVAAALAFQ
jgi:hypothetical protein